MIRQETGSIRNFVLPSIKFTEWRQRIEDTEKHRGHIMCDCHDRILMCRLHYRISHVGRVLNLSVNIHSL